MSPEAPPIDLARYAEVTAHLRRFPSDKRDEVIARLGLRRRDWEAASARWSAARDAELASGKSDLTLRFGAVVTRTRARLEAQRASLESLGPLPGPDELAPDAPPAAAAPEPPSLVEIAAPAIQIISAQRAPPQPGAPSFLVRQPALHDLPAAVVAPPAVVAPRALVPVSSPPHHLQSTLPLGAVLPLARLPFQEAPVEPSRAFAAAVAHAEIVQGPAEARRNHHGMGGTVGVSSDAPSPALPFASPLVSIPSLPPGLPDLTVAQYASLRVELQTHPDRAAPILSRYGVPVAARAALEDHWRTRFQVDPPLRMEFARAYAAYTAWLRSHPG